MTIQKKDISIRPIVIITSHESIGALPFGNLLYFHLVFFRRCKKGMYEKSFYFLLVYVFFKEDLLLLLHQEVEEGELEGTLWPAPWCWCSVGHPWHVLLRNPYPSAKMKNEKR